MLEENKPAAAGGIPAKKTPFGKETRYGAEELRELNEAIEQGTLFYAQGRKTATLEERYAAEIGSRFAIAVSSGTAAIHTALMAAGISPGDEVITSPITDMGTVIPILFQQAVPVFADLHPRSYCLLPESVEAAITPNTRAVIAVHLWGNACDLDALSSICDRRGIVLIEDCAQAFGCTYKGKPVGTYGQIGCFSLNEFKHISCGDGGIVVTDDENLAKRLRLASDKCYDRSPGAGRSPTFLANNYRITELQSAVALAQLGKLDSIVERRRRWCEALSRELDGMPGILLPQPIEGCNPSWWFYMLRVDPAKLGTDTDTFAEALKAEGLPVGAHYIGRCVYEYPMFVEHTLYERGTHPFAARDYHKGLCPNAEGILDTGIILYLNEAYTDVDLEETVFAIRRAASWYSQ